MLADWEKGSEALAFTRGEPAAAARAKGKGAPRRKGAGPEVVDAKVVD